ncbi:hypothetical protein K9L97_01805 [Candidatus Woesearchaeota archaeon]|nr:hypothetical protein [Candidatus Woesearchaeota archaeon]
MKSVLLIYSEHDPPHNKLDSGYKHEPPSLGLTTLENIVKKEMPDVNIKIIDGRFSTTEEIKKEIKKEYDFVGYGDLFFNHNNTLKYVQFTRENSPKSKILVGNVNGEALGVKLLKNKLVDYVIAQYGEAALLSLLKETNQKNKIINIPHNINKLPTLNFDTFKKYIKQWDSRQKDYNIDKITPFPISTTRGCIKALKKDLCMFCSTPYNAVKVLSPKNFWKMVESLNKYGINYFFETGDDFLIGEYPQKVLRERPSHLENVYFRFYGDLDAVTKKRMEILKELNLRDFFIGLENVDEKILTNMKKRYDINYDNFNDIFSKYDILESLGINFYIPILLGTKDESSESLNKNKEFIKEASKRYSYLTKVYADIVVPTPGAQLFDELLKNEKILQDYKKYYLKMHEDEQNADLNKAIKFDYPLLMKLMIKYTTKTNITEILETKQEMLESASKYMIETPINFGMFSFEKYSYVK